MQNEIKKTHWVMDYETLSDCFVGVFEDYKIDKRHIFVIGTHRNDLSKLLSFFKQNIQSGERHISFNGLAFDGQITDYIIRNRKKLLRLGGRQTAQAIYKFAQKTIERSKAGDFPKYNPNKLFVKQIDIFKLNHWDSGPKRSSLKWIQFTTDWPNLQDMPIHHNTSVTDKETLKTIVKYCINDVASTKHIMKKCSKEIKLRINLSSQYGMDLYSASEPKMAKEIFLHFMSKKMQIEKNRLKKMRTHRNRILVKEILLPFLRYNTKPFRKMLFRFQHLAINANNTKGAFSYTLEYRGVKTKLGMGGVHGARKGIFEASEEMLIMSSDVVSYYPNLVIRNKWSPKHLPEEDFCQQYEWFFNERRKIPKSNPMNYVYKIILNSTFGLSINRHNFIYDPRLGMQITINGQLLLMMLYEMLSEEIPGCLPLMQNTDGVEMMIPKEYRDKYLEICDRWERMTNLELEHDQYQKLVIPDVNNYVGVFKPKEVTKSEFEELQKEKPNDVFETRIEGKLTKYYHSATKAKGRFDFEGLALHKNKSFLIVRKALFNYFVHGIEPEKTLSENSNIYDYCAGVKIRGNWKFVKRDIEKGEYKEEDLQKTLRYYISKNGSKIIKRNLEDGRELNLETKGSQVVFNKYVEKPWEDYEVDELFYIKAIYKEIGNLIPEIVTGQKEFEF